MKSPPAASNRRASQDWTVGVFVTPEERPPVRDEVNGVVVGIPLPRRRRRRNAIGRVQDEIPCCSQVRRCDKACHDRSGGHEEFQSSHLALLQDRYLACSILHNSLTVRKCPRHRLFALRHAASYRGTHRPGDDFLWWVAPEWLRGRGLRGPALTSKWTGPLHYSLAAFAPKGLPVTPRRRPSRMGLVSSRRSRSRSPDFS
jgi:hypothetical protein